MKDLPSNKVETTIFDAIFVCNGHNSVPFLPHFEGIETFEGRHMHSHDYRRAETFKGSFIVKISWVNPLQFKTVWIFISVDKRVLIIGAGPSGIDLTFLISKYATQVIFSHHTHRQNYVYPSNVILKGSVQQFTKNGVIFKDGTNTDVTEVVFCTGEFQYQPSIYTIGQFLISLFISRLRIYVSIP